MISHRIGILLLSGLICSVPGVCGTGPDAAEEDVGTVMSTESRPHVVLISVDTLRRDHLPVYGYSRNTAPELGRLAAEGVVFENAIAAHTMTAPSHASMFTSLHPASHGVLRNGLKLRSSCTTLAEVLAERGYFTGAFVSSWTMDAYAELDRGFQKYNDDFPTSGRGARRDGIATWNQAAAWLRRNARGWAPVFLFLHVFEPHFPYQPPASKALRFLPGRGALTTAGHRLHFSRLRSENGFTDEELDEYGARYDGEIVVADGLLGRVLDELERLEILDESLVIFVSDHGETLFERRWMMDHGCRVYDEQIRVPLVMRFPNGRWAAKRVQAQVSHVDLMPTILDVVGIEATKGGSGRSLVPILGADEPDVDPRPMFSNCRAESGRVPHVPAELLKDGLVSAVRLPTVKLIEYPTAAGGWYQELFDLTSDPAEQRNLAAERPEGVRVLHTLLEQWRAETGAERVVPRLKLDPDAEEKLRALGYID